MKKYFSILIVAILMIVVIPTMNEAQSQIAQWNQKVTKLATDSTLANETSKQSQTFTQFAYTRYGTVQSQTNYLNSSYVTVSAYQTNDSIRANVYLLYGQITGGTLGQDYFKVYVDSLYKGVDSIGTKHTSININVAQYMVYPQLAVYVTGKYWGNGYLPVWNAVFGGAGYDIKQTPQ